MSEIVTATAAELSRRLQAKEVSAVEVTQAHLDRIAQVDGEVHAFLHVNDEEALATARDVDERRARGEELHPLAGVPRSEEHTSELQSRENLVCRLLLEKKKNK